MNDLGKFLILSERNCSQVKKFMPSEEQTGALAVFFQNLADSTRLKILSCLSLCDMCVNDMCELLSMNQTTISHQLKILKDQNLVNFKRDGKLIIYSLKEKMVGEMLSFASESI